MPDLKYSQLERGVTAMPECAFKYSQLEAAIASMHNVPANFKDVQEQAEAFPKNWTGAFLAWKRSKNRI